MLTDTTHPHLDLRWLQEAGHSGLLIAVLGDLGEHDKPVLTRMRHSASGALAVALDVPAWARGSAPARPAPRSSTAWLGAHGWRAVSAGPAGPARRRLAGARHGRAQRATAATASRLPTAPLTGSAS